jgi:phosphatidylserine decarboxylase
VATPEEILARVPLFSMLPKEELAKLASDANEQTVLTVAGVVGGVPTSVMFKQIAGLIARRIICYKKPGDVLDAGERIGLIKFGSRVDVFLGPEWDITVRAGDRVSAGSSVIARIREAAAPAEEV